MKLRKCKTCKGTGYTRKEWSTWADPHVCRDCWRPKPNPGGQYNRGPFARRKAMTHHLTMPEGR